MNFSNEFLKNTPNVYIQYRNSERNKVNNVQYVEAAVSTKSDKFYQPVVGQTGPNIDIDILHAIVGISTESGEILDVAKKSMFYGKPVDYTNLDEEMGDVLWYIGVYCYARGVKIEQLMDQNIAKLRARFPNKFTEFDANNRDLQTEREILDNHSEKFGK